jgi:hypothetical protein
MNLLEMTQRLELLYVQLWRAISFSEKKKNKMMRQEMKKLERQILELKYLIAESHSHPKKLTT